MMFNPLYLTNRSAYLRTMREDPRKGHRSWGHLGGISLLLPLLLLLLVPSTQALSKKKIVRSVVQSSENVLNDLNLLWEDIESQNNTVTDMEEHANPPFKPWQQFMPLKVPQSLFSTEFLKENELGSTGVTLGCEENEDCEALSASIDKLLVVCRQISEGDIKESQQTEADQVEATVHEKVTLEDDAWREGMEVDLLNETISEVADAVADLKDKLDELETTELIIIISCSVGGVVLLVIAVTITIYCIKKKKKDEKTDEARNEKIARYTADDKTSPTTGNVNGSPPNIAYIERSMLLSPPRKDGTSLQGAGRIQKKESTSAVNSEVTREASETEKPALVTQDISMNSQQQQDKDHQADTRAHYRKDYHQEQQRQENRASRVDGGGIPQQRKLPPHQQQQAHYQHNEQPERVNYRNDHQRQNQEQYQPHSTDGYENGRGKARISRPPGRYDAPRQGARQYDGQTDRSSRKSLRANTSKSQNRISTISSQNRYRRRERDYEDYTRRSRSDDGYRYSRSNRYRRSSSDHDYENRRQQDNRRRHHSRSSEFEFRDDDHERYRHSTTRRPKSMTYGDASRRAIARREPYEAYRRSYNDDHRYS